MKKINKLIIVFGTAFILIIGGNYYSTNIYAKGKIDYSKIVICIDPGHQSKGNSETEPISPGSKIKKAKVTSGTRGVFTKVPEYKLNLKISLILENLLKNQGFKVIMTRETNDVNISNIERAMIANKANADLCIRIHADGSNNKNMHGISVLYPAESSNKKNIYEKSKTIAGIILSSVITETSAKANGIKARADLTGFNWSKVPNILIEAGFMTNIGEDKKLEDSSYEQKIAEGIVLGTEAYFDGLGRIK